MPLPRFPHSKPNLDSPAALDTAEVIKYGDCYLEPPPIGPTTFFFRHTFRSRTKHVTVSAINWSIVCLTDHPRQPFSDKEVCSICNQPYNPDVAQLSPDQFTMHFCPRDTCQTACHRECLSSHPIKKRPTCGDRKMSLLCSVPSNLLDSPASPSLLSLLSKSKPASQSQSRTKKRKRASAPDALSLFEDLPPDLVELASQPIVKPTFEPERPKRRRGKTKAAEPQNIIKDVAGNVTVVLKARVLVNDILRGTATLPRDWGKKIGWEDAPTSIVDSGENSSCPPLLCPTCGEHI